MANQEIDLESLFNDPKNITEFHPNDLSIQTDIDQVLSHAIAEITENQRIIDFGPHSNLGSGQNNITIPLLPQKRKQTFDINVLEQENFAEQLEIKPLTPESLLATDDSHINTPIDHQMFQISSNPTDIEQILDDSFLIKEEQAAKASVVEEAMVRKAELEEQNQNLTKELERYKRLAETRFDNLKKSMIELKKSEIARLELMEENRDLKKVVRNLTLNASSSQ